MSASDIDKTHYNGVPLETERDLLGVVAAGTTTLRAELERLGIDVDAHMTELAAAAAAEALAAELLDDTAVMP